MLARLAENMFWAGRYVERAGDTARLLDSTFHGRLELEEERESQLWDEVLDTLGQRQAFRATNEGTDSSAVVSYIVNGAGNPGSIVSSVRLARENVRSLREQISTELWEAVNEMWLDVRSRNMAVELDRQAYRVFQSVKRDSQTIVGAAHETMPRDDGWRFFELGRCLESAIMTCRLLRVSIAQLVNANRDVAFHHWVILLKSAGALEAYRRLHHPTTDATEAISFLLTNESFPRSVRFNVATSSRILHELRNEELTGALSARILGRLTADLEFSDVGLLVADDELAAFLDQVLNSAQLAVEAVTNEFFRVIEATDLRVQYA